MSHGDAAGGEPATRWGDPDRSPVWRVGLVATLVAVATWYATNLAGAMNIDETLYARFGLGLFRGQPYQNPTHAFAPTVKYVVGASQLLLGESSVAVRLPIAVFGVVTVYLTYRLAADVRNRRAGVVAAALLGGTYYFATLAVVGMLDVPLAAFVVGTVLVAARWLEEGRRRQAALLGVVAAFALTTKVYGFIYVLPTLGVVAGVTVSRRGLGDAARALRPTLVAGAATLAVLYVPYLLVPHPTVQEQYAPGAVMGVVRALLAIPVVGNFVYIFGAAVIQNLVHSSHGHAMTVGATVYQVPPVWAYLYWIFQHGGVVYAVLLPLGAAGASYEAVRRDSPRALLLAVAIVVPLAGMSVLSVKMPRYVLPLYPLVAAVGVAYADVAASELHDLVGGPHYAPSSPLFSGLFVLLVLVAGMAPPSPMLAAVDDPIGTDTGYDEVTAPVEAYAAANPDETVTVLAYHNATFEYYYDGPPTVRNVGLGASFVRSNETYHDHLLSLLRSGAVEYVVDLEHNPRLKGLGVYEYVRAHSTVVETVTRSPEGDTLVLYRIEPENETARVAHKTPQPPLAPTDEPRGHGPRTSLTADNPRIRSVWQSLTMGPDHRVPTERWSPLASWYPRTTLTWLVSRPTSGQSTR